MIENKPHILLVEDTDAVREVIGRQLRTLGCHVTEANDGAQAFAMLGQGLNPPVTMVITDLNMPRMNGQQLRGKIHGQAKWKDMRIIMLTADPVPESYCGDYLQKPVALEDMKNLVEGKELSYASQISAGTKAPASAIDREALIEQMGELDDGAIEMLKLFPKMMRPILDDVRSALLGNDFAKLELSAHSLKGAARSAGALTLGDICNDIQICAQQQQDGRHLIDRLNAAYHDVEVELAKIGGNIT